LIAGHHNSPILVFVGGTQVIEESGFEGNAKETFVFWLGF
jgi:hypothetical protein